jgi:hypothetical protein
VPLSAIFLNARFQLTFEKKHDNRGFLFSSGATGKMRVDNKTPGKPESKAKKNFFW